ncbi:MAG: FkbM family methyltransferase [Paracoccaceae bacterium]|jgi:FkbM family methyltransferase
MNAKLVSKLRRLALAPFSVGNYIAFVGIFRVCTRPFDAFRRYAFGVGAYPTDMRVRTPTGTLTLRLYQPADMLTLNEVFCRGDYRADRTLGLVVDFGSNIGLSAAYFLSRNDTARIHLYEPDQRNIVKLHAQLAPFKGRYTLHEVAVGVSDGELTFAHEETGRYGGLSDAMSQSWVAEAPTSTVTCVDAERELAEIIAAEGEVDVLKVDIEGMEIAVLRHLSARTRGAIRLIYAEMDCREAQLDGLHRRQKGSIAVYRRSAPHAPA